MIPHLPDPPRAVPLLVAAQLLFGRAAARVGWLVFGFGMVFFWAFAVNSELADLFAYRGKLQSASGTLVSIEATPFSEGGGEDGEGTPIVALRYRFAFQGRQYEGISYQSGADAPAEAQAEVRQAVTVEFPAGRPDRSRVRGMRSAPFEAGLAAVTLFPFVGLVLIVATLRRGWLCYRLVRRGRAAVGRLVSREQTNVSVNDEPVYRLTFEFDASPGHPARTTIRTHRTEELTDSEEQPLLYDPARPARTVMLRRFPASVRIEGDEGISVHNARSAWLALVVPTLTVVGHGAFALARYAF